MTENWKHFLIQQGAIINDGQVLHFGNESEEKKAALNEHVVYDLSHYGLIRAYGDEAEGFLQNQFCNDVRNVSDERSHFSGYCNPKGRALAFFRLFLTEGHYYLRLPREILDDTMNRLRMFVLMSKVTLEDASDELVVIGFSGPQAGQRLSKLTVTTPATVNDVTHTGSLTIVKVSDSPERFEIYGNIDEIQSAWEDLVADARPAGIGSWELLDIQDGIPEIVTETREAFVPQMINLQAIDALSFKKGCYPGQEIVARMQYLGKLKRHMFRAHIKEDVVPSPGDSLFTENSDSGQGAGKVVRAQSNPGGGVDLLAVIELASKEKGALRLNDTEGPVLDFIPLPYSLDQE